jgi:hypothetical protein
MFLNQERFKLKEKLYFMCKENFMSVSVVIFARKNFFLLDSINKKITLLQAGGLIEFWHSNVIDKRFMKIQPGLAPRKLNINQLSGSFILLSFGLTVATFVFVVEVLTKFANK